MLCCANCFGDLFLNKRIPEMSEQTGVCDVCLTPNTPLVQPESLREYFQSVCSIYSEDNGVDAELLVTWFQRDWEIFTAFDPLKAQTLLGEILDDGEVVRKKHLPRNIPELAAVEKWTSFRDEIICKNRFFFKHELDLDLLNWLFSNLAGDDSIFAGSLYRARIQTEDSPIPIDEMGKPAAACAKNGRANPVGIPYLYAASTPETAIAETRPHPGDLLSVAKFSVTEPLKLLNLQHPRKTISPFLFVNEEALSVMRDNLDFLCHLGSELSKPILPRVADLEYLPTQYLCEFIKNCGYDGVVFMSSIGIDANIALFDDSKVQPVELNQYEVTSVHYDQIKLVTT